MSVCACVHAVTLAQVHRSQTHSIINRINGLLDVICKCVCVCYLCQHGYFTLF